MYCFAVRRLKDTRGQGGAGRMHENGARVFFAISDPTRRRMLDLLLISDLSVTQLAKPFRMSQPAISQHLRVLRKAGLVEAERMGRERRYRLRGQRLRGVYDWVGHYQKFWNEKLTALGSYLDDDARESKTEK
jgi:DNA-binding transcriptional ArsR family regulator